ncbi:MAG TPA: diguanylate phosphodiesterase, partial [Thermoanaerobaculia bacterium]|nr:diguanylate phosphodiesterase [Thermoanaerobaculia bacterium]
MTEDKAAHFLEIFTKAKDFTESLVRENQRLRYRVASLESDATSREEIDALRQQVEQLSTANEAMHRRFTEVEEENRNFATRYVEVEQQNTNLANLYVASYQLHSTLEFREVIR